MANLWFSSKIALCILLLSLSLTPTESRNSFFSRFGSSSSNRQQARPPHDMASRSELNDLYNTRVVQVEKVSNSMPSYPSFVKHEGVRATLEDGRTLLIHKGSNYGLSSQTVVVDAKHMSPKWKVEETKPMSGKTVGDLVKSGGSSYRLLSDNCWHAAKRMMQE